MKVFQFVVASNLLFFITIIILSKVLLPECGGVNKLWCCHYESTEITLFYELRTYSDYTQIGSYGNNTLCSLENTLDKFEKGIVVNGKFQKEEPSVCVTNINGDTGTCYHGNSLMNVVVLLFLPRYINFYYLNCRNIGDF